MSNNKLYDCGVHFTLCKFHLFYTMRLSSFANLIKRNKIQINATHKKNECKKKSWNHLEITNFAWDKWWTCKSEMYHQLVKYTQGNTEIETQSIRGADCMFPLKIYKRKLLHSINFISIHFQLERKRVKMIEKDSERAFVCVYFCFDCIIYECLARWCDLLGKCSTRLVLALSHWPKVELLNVSQSWAIPIRFDLS